MLCNCPPNVSCVPICFIIIDFFLRSRSHIGIMKIQVDICFNSSSVINYRRTALLANSLFWLLSAYSGIVELKDSSFMAHFAPLMFAVAPYIIWILSREDLFISEQKKKKERICWFILRHISTFYIIQQPLMGSLLFFYCYFIHFWNIGQPLIFVMLALYPESLSQNALQQEEREKERERESDRERYREGGTILRRIKSFL